MCMRVCVLCMFVHASCLSVCVYVSVCECVCICVCVKKKKKSETELTASVLKKLEKDDYIENLHALSCFVLLKSVLLISCVFWIFFSERWQSTLFQILIGHETTRTEF